MIVGLFPSWVWAQTIDNEFHETSSGTKALKLAADPGELYSLEISSLLTGWSTVKEWYGLGQEVEQNLFAHPNTSGPDNGDAAFSDPAVSLLVQRGGGGNGVIVSWRSLDDGTARQVYSASTTLHSNWPATLVKNGEGHRFFICKESQPAVFNPLSEAPSTTFDAAMYSAFQSNLPIFNTAIGAGNLSPDPIALPPKTSAIGSKQFYRIRRGLSPDTDKDGILDKHEIASHGTSPFSRNTDGDVYDDNDEIQFGFNPVNAEDIKDTDNDKIPDYLDVHPGEAVLDWEKLPDTLYSWSPLPLPANSGTALGIANDEKVYFSKGVLSPAGTWQALTTQVIALTHEIYDAVATGFNDLGQMVGVAYVNWPSINYTTFSAAIYWPSPTAPPVIIGRGEPFVWSWYGVPTISNDGTIHVQGVRNWDPGGAFYTTANTSTRAAASLLSYNYFLPAGGIVQDYKKASFAHRQLGAGTRYFVNPNLTTYQNLVAYKNGNYTTLTNNIPSFFNVNDVSVLPNGRGVIVGSAGTWGNAVFFEKKDGTWTGIPGMTFASKVSRRGEFTQGTNIWRNGQSTPIIGLAPQLSVNGYFNASSASINDAGVMYAFAYNVAGQPTKPIVYGILRPAEFGIDVISRDELTGTFIQEGGVIEQSRAIPSVNLTVTDSRLLSSGTVEIDVTCTVRDPISELIANPDLRLQEINLYIDGKLVETVNDLPAWASGASIVPVWQPYPSQYSFQRTYTISNARTGSINIRAETGINPAGNLGWDIASILLTRAGSAEAEGGPNTDFALRLTGNLGSSTDTLFGSFGAGTESALIETSGSSLEFSGSVMDDGISKSVTVILDKATVLSSSSPDVIQGWLQISSGGTTNESLLKWNETTASGYVFAPHAQIGIEGSGITSLPPLRVAHVAKGARSLQGNVKPFLVRLAFKSGTLAQVGSNYRFEINGVSYPVVTNNSLVPGQSPPAGMEWGYAAANGVPKLFAPAPYQDGVLIPAGTLARGGLSAVLWNNITDQPAASGAWALTLEPRSFAPTPPPLNPPIMARAGAKYTKAQVFEFYDLIFMEYGKILKDAMEGRGLVIKVTNVYNTDPRDWVRKNFTPRDKSLGLTPELWVDDELDNVSDATVALFEGLYALKKWYVRDDLRLAVFDDVLDDAIAGDGDFELVYRELHEARLGAIGDALEAFATAAEIGLAIVNEPFDYVMSFTTAAEHYQKGEIVQGTATACLAVLPFVCGRLSKAGKVIQVDLPGSPFSVSQGAQGALAKSILKNITRVERMNILGPFIQNGTIDANLVEKLWVGGFLKYKNSASSVLRTNLEAQLQVSKRWGEITHHDLPVKFDLEFLMAGIDINQGACTGRFLSKNFHKKLHNAAGWGTIKGSPGNYQWSQFFIEYPLATLAQIVEFRDFMRALTANPNVDVSQIAWRYPKP